MAEEPAAPVDISQTRAGQRWGVILAVSAFNLSAMLIAYIVLFGRPENSLHVSALSWAFTMIIAILGAMGMTGLTTAMSIYLRGGKN